MKASWFSVLKREKSSSARHISGRPFCCHTHAHPLLFGIGMTKWSVNSIEFRISEFLINVGFSACQVIAGEHRIRQQVTYAVQCLRFPRNTELRRCLFGIPSSMIANPSSCRSISK
ncbi:hypothetical protein PQR34_44345 [Paraburkholderia sediminicola]|uniref:hypothetical protein n=1 Tax=Paraburkholderia sediminicola TaxID=458836 RepID=UPI0038B84849